MSQYSGPYTGDNAGQAQQSSTDVAKEETAGVGHVARDAGRQVAGTATDQARQVAGEASMQARDLLGEAAGHAQEQASAQQRKAAEQMRTLADELHDMAAKASEPGMAADLARQAAGRISDAASWLDKREPGDLVEEIRTFARRRPGLFLAGAAVAGLAAGRMTRGLTAASHGPDNGSPQSVAEPGFVSPEPVPAAVAVTDPGWATSGPGLAGQEPVPAPGTTAGDPVGTGPLVPDPAVPYPADIGADPGYRAVPEPGDEPGPDRRGQS